MCSTTRRAALAGSLSERRGRLGLAGRRARAAQPGKHAGRLTTDAEQAALTLGDDDDLDDRGVHRPDLALELA